MSNNNENNTEDIIENTERAIKLSETSGNLGVTYQYKGNRQKLWDSAKAKKEYKDSVFGDKKTIVDKNGNLLHKNQAAAQRKYHMKNSEGENTSKAWAKHTPETDHKISLESLHSHAKHNPFLTDEDLKEIANSFENYQILSKSENASKGAAISATLKDHAVMQGKFAQKIVKNAAGEFKTGAMESVQSSAFFIIMDSLDKLLVEGESLEDTAKDAGKAVVNAVIVGGTEKLLIDTATHIFKNSGNEVLKNIVNMNAVGQCLVLGAAIGSSAIKYINGEITAKEFSEEILISGIAIGISTAISIAIPVPFIGPIISCIAVTAITAIYEFNRHMDDYLLKEKEIKKLEHEAIAEMEYQRNRFHEMIQNKLDEWDSTVEEAFSQIISSSFEESFSLEGIVGGLDKILSLCDEKARFHTLEEWEEQLDMPLELSF